MSRSGTPLAVVFASVFAVSFFAYGQLGGPDGITVPYQGRLEQGGMPVNSLVTLRFDMFADGVASSPCHTQSFSLVPANGAFSVQLSEVPASCVRGAEPQLAIAVDGDNDDDDGDFVVLPGRQRLFPAPMATTSGSGDFAVTSSLTVGDPSSPTVALHNNFGGGPMLAGSNVSGNLHLDSNTPPRPGADGSLYLNYYAQRPVRFGRSAEIDADGNLSTQGSLYPDGEISAGGAIWSSTGIRSSGAIESSARIGVNAADGALGASTNFYFRDTGDTWLRLRNNLDDFNTSYADLAVGNVHVDGNLRVVNNAHESCSWTGRFSEEQSAVYCPGGKYVAGAECFGDYCDQIALLCCAL